MQINDTTTDADLVRVVAANPAATPLERTLALRLSQHLERIAVMDRQIAEWAQRDRYADARG